MNIDFDTKDEKEIIETNDNQATKENQDIHSKSSYFYLILLLIFKNNSSDLYFDNYYKNFIFQFNSFCQEKYENLGNLSISHHTYIRMLFFSEILKNQDEKKISEATFFLLESCSNPFIYNEIIHFLSIIMKPPKYKNYNPLFTRLQIFFDQNMNYINDLDARSFKIFFDTFININLTENLLKEYDNKILKPLVDLKDLNGFSFLFQFIISSKDENISNLAIKSLFSLIKGYNYENLFQYFCNLATDLISSNNSKIELDRLIYIFHSLIKKSEYNVFTRVKPFKLLNNDEIICILIKDYTGKLDNNTMRIFKNTTCWNLRERLSHKLKVCVDFFDLSVGNKEITLQDNNKSLNEIGLEDYSQIKVFLNSKENLIPQEELCIDDKVNPKIIKILEQLFYDFSTDKKMKPEQCAKLIKYVTGSKDSISPDDFRIKNLFDNYDKDKDNLLDCNEFVDFYSEACLKQDKKRVVWDNLRTMEIRNDLKKMEEPFTEYIKDTKLLFRYFLVENKIIFKYFFENLTSINPFIQNQSYDFLSNLPPSQDIFNSIFDKIASDDLLVNWDLLLFTENPFQMNYCLRILCWFFQEFNFYDCSKKQLISLNYNENKTSSDISFDMTDYFILVNQSKKEVFQNKKLKFLTNFVIKGGISALQTILITIKNNSNEENFTSISNSLLSIIKIYFKLFLIKSTNSNQYKNELKMIIIENMKISKCQTNEQIESDTDYILSSFDSNQNFIPILKESINRDLILEFISTNYQTDQIKITFDYFEMLLLILSFSQQEFQKYSEFIFSTLSCNNQIIEKFAKDRMESLVFHLKELENLNYLNEIYGVLKGKLKLFDNKYMNQLYSILNEELNFPKNKAVNEESIDLLPNLSFHVEAILKDLESSCLLENKMPTELFLLHLNQIIIKIKNHCLDLVLKYKFAEEILLKIILIHKKIDIVIDKMFVEPVEYKKFDLTKICRIYNKEVFSKCVQILNIMINSKIVEISLNILNIEIDNPDIGNIKYDTQESYLEKKESILAIHCYNNKFNHINSIIQGLLSLNFFREKIISMDEGNSNLLFNELQKISAFYELSIKYYYNPKNLYKLIENSFFMFENLPLNFLNWLFSNIKSEASNSIEINTFINNFEIKYFDNNLNKNYIEVKIENNYNLDESLRNIIAENKIIEFPSFLIIIINRVKYNIQNYKNVKNFSKFEFPIKLQIDTEKTVINYDLMSIVNHMGDLEDGYFYSIAKSKNKWFNIQDHIISEYDISNIENDCFGFNKSENENINNKKTAFLLFYQKQNIKDLEFKKIIHPSLLKEIIVDNCHYKYNYLKSKEELSQFGIKLIKDMTVIVKNNIEAININELTKGIINFIFKLEDSYLISKLSFSVVKTFIINDNCDFSLKYLFENSKSLKSILLGNDDFFKDFIFTELIYEIMIQYVKEKKKNLNSDFTVLEQFLSIILSFFTDFKNDINFSFNYYFNIIEKYSKIQEFTKILLKSGYHKILIEHVISLNDNKNIGKKQNNIHNTKRIIQFLSVFFNNFNNNNEKLYLEELVPFKNEFIHELIADYNFNFLVDIFCYFSENDIGFTLYTFKILSSLFGKKPNKNFIKSALKLLNIKDDLINYRIENILGIPQLNIIDKNEIYPFHFLGRNMIKEKKSGFYHFPSFFRLDNYNNNITLFQAFFFEYYSFSSNEESEVICDFIRMAESNPIVYEYLKHLPPISVGYKNFFEWASEKINKSKSEYQEEFTKSISSIEAKLKEITISESQFLNLEEYYYYSIKDIKYEIVSLYQIIAEGLYLFRIDFSAEIDTNYVIDDTEISNNAINQIKKGKYTSFENMNAHKKNTYQIQEETNENILSINALNLRETQDDIFKKILQTKKTIKIYNPYEVCEPKFIASQFILFNESDKPYFIKLSFQRDELSKVNDYKYNEYIPVSKYQIFLEKHSYKQVLTLQKIIPILEWTMNDLKLNYEFENNI